jgi:DNA repair exonuclease SbcCD ATPase subunit
MMEIKAEGFRGINAPVRLKVDGKSLLLFGDNGAGKTSLLQSIEWCMFGELTYLPAEEYKLEDALVNSFNANGTAKVELTMEDEKGKTVQLIRTRKRGKSTTKGKNPLTLRIDSRELTGDDAEQELARLLELTPEEYYARTHLHQETVRDLLFGQITDRSAMIDKMLGLYRLRQLVESLPISTVDREIKAAEGDLQDGKEEKQTYEKALSQLKTDLQALGEELAKSGVQPEQASLVVFGERFSTASAELAALAGLVGHKIRKIDAPGTIEEAKRSPDLIGKELAQIEDKRTKAYGDLQKELADCDNFSQEYQKGLAEQAETKVDPAKLTDEKNAVLKQINDLTQTENRLKKIDSELRGEANVTGRLLEERRSIEGKLRAIREKYGDGKAISTSIQQSEESIKKVKQSIDRQGLAAKIVALGSQYFQTSEDETCPLCESRISRVNVRSSLERRAKEQEEAKLIHDMQEEITRYENQISTLRRNLQDSDGFSTKLNGNTRELDETRKRIISLGLEAPDVADLPVFIKAKQEETGKQLTETADRIREAERRKLALEGIEKRISAFQALEKKIQQRITTASSGKQLLKELDNFRKGMDERASGVAKLGDRASSLRDGVTVLKSIADFLTKKTDMEKMEKTMLPGVIKKLETLDSKLKKMHGLGAAIHDIHDAAISAQQDFLKTTIGALEKEINRIYSEIVPHTHFVKLKLVPEEVRGQYVYRIQALSLDGKDSTFVQTRFSLAQLNVVALVLFLAMGRSEPGFLVFDDPTQSLDFEHKKALVSVLAEIGLHQQLLVATQDAEFEEELKRRSAKMKAQVVELGSWSTRGPKIKT